MEIFSFNLRQRASELGLSHAEVARRLDLSERRYAHYARGDREPDLSTLVRISQVLQLSVDSLLGQQTPADKNGSDRLLDQIASAARLLDENDLRLFVVLIEAAAKRDR